jgi:ion channel
MSLLAVIAALVLASAVLWDAFETILLPRRSAAQLRMSRFVMRGLWWFWRRAALRVRRPAQREGLLSVYPILSLLLLLAVWGMALIAAFALLYRGFAVHVHAPDTAVTFPTLLYFSGSTFLTLGLGDVVPVNGLARALVVIEAGTGLGFLALLLSYLPVLYQSFSRREARITLLDSWSASPPSAAVVLRRNAESGDRTALNMLLREWETTAAELLESHISYPVLAFYRSQHDNQSWLGSLTTVLDTCALVIAGVDGIPSFQARLTFAIARHAVVDICQMFRRVPEPPATDRLPAEELTRLRDWLTAANVHLIDAPDVVARLHTLRGLYEPYVGALADYLLMPLPTFQPPERLRFNWQTTAWARTGDERAH